MSDFIRNRKVKSTAIYFVGNVLSKLIVFFLLPIYTTYINASDMGYYDTSVTIITLFSCVLFLDIGTTILKYSLEKKEYQNNVITIGVIIFSGSSILYFLLLSFGAVLFNFQYYWWVVLYGFFYSMNTAIGYCARALDRNFDYAVAGVIQTAVLALSNLLLILVLKFDYSSLFISFVFSNIVSNIYMIVRTKLICKLKTFNIDRTLFTEMFRFSLPLCVNSIAFWLLSSSSRVLVSYMLGTEAVGYLSVANKFNQILYLASSCFQLTWQETAYEHDNHSDSTAIFYSSAFITYYKAVMYCVLILIPAIAVGLWIMPNFIDTSYSISIGLIPLALIGTGLAIISLFIGTIFSALKKTRVIFTSTLTGAIVTVATTVIFIKCDIGPASANYSFILGYIATISMRICILKRYMAFKCDWKTILLFVPLLLVVLYVYNNCKAVICLILLLVLFVLVLFIFKNEINSILGKGSGD